MSFELGATQKFRRLVQLKQESERNVSIRKSVNRLLRKRTIGPCHYHNKKQGNYEMFAKPQQEHRWLNQLVGQWKFEHNCEMPDGTKSTASGTMSSRSLGGMWLICESSGESPDGEWSTVMTLGFDPAQNQFVGTFLGSMMANIWLYQGDLDAKGTRLPLYAEGPKFDGSGMGKYRDTIEIVDANTWLFTSELQSDEANWQQFMVGKHTRA